MVPGPRSWIAPQPRHTDSHPGDRQRGGSPAGGQHLTRLSACLSVCLHTGTGLEILRRVHRISLRSALRGRKCSDLIFDPEDPEETDPSRSIRRMKRLEYFSSAERSQSSHPTFFTFLATAPCFVPPLALTAPLRQLPACLLPCLHFRHCAAGSRKCLRLFFTSIMSPALVQHISIHAVPGRLPVG